MTFQTAFPSCRRSVGMMFVMKTIEIFWGWRGGGWSWPGSENESNHFVSQLSHERINDHDTIGITYLITISFFVNFFVQFSVSIVCILFHLQSPTPSRGATTVWKKRSKDGTPCPLFDAKIGDSTPAITQALIESDAPVVSQRYFVWPTIVFFAAIAGVVICCWAPFHRRQCDANAAQGDFLGESGNFYVTTVLFMLFLVFSLPLSIVYNIQYSS